MPFVITLFLFLVGFVLPGATEVQELTIYSSRSEPLLAPLIDAFEESKGVKVHVFTGEAGPLIQRLKAEGESSRADIFMAVDAGNLWYAAEQGLLEAPRSSILRERIPANYRSEQDQWFGLSQRVRVVFYNKERVDQKKLSTYEALAEDYWRGKLCMRTSRKVYNQSLVAMLAHRLGRERTLEVVKGWVNNLAHPVFSNDTQVLRAVEEGRCAIGIANSYYFGRILADGGGKSVGIHFPPMTHVNLSGAGVVRGASEKALAVTFLEWLVSDEGQKLFTHSNFEYPVIEGVDPHPIVKSWGEWQSDPAHLNQAGQGQRGAMQIIDRAGYR